MKNLLKLNHLFLATWLFLIHSAVTHAAESNMSLENATWEVFSRQSMVQLLVLAGRNEDFLLDTGKNLFLQGVSLNNVQWKLFSSQGAAIQSLVLGDNKTFLATTTRGLAQFDITTGERKELFTTKQGLPDNGITRLLKDDSNGVWVGTANGLAYLDLDKLNSAENPITAYTTENSGLPLSDVFTIDLDGNGGIWIQVSASPTEMGEILLGKKPEFLKEDGTYTLSALTHRSQDGKWTTYPVYPLGSFCWNYLVNDGIGGVWMLAYVKDGILAELRHLTSNGEWITYTKEDLGVSGNFYPFRLLSDGNGGIWAGMRHVDLAGTPKVYSVKDAGLSENSWVYPSSLNDGTLRVELDSDPIRFFDLNDEGTWIAASSLEFFPLWSSWWNMGCCK
ncbi:MAG: hypothetical protein BWK78_07110 [Thiotrichaceae bacterium IS1]|nr:MAG: hypothetical protein BWK78_07110 [Thiotrichaceae bacterium IS1]